jgi:hypothetical protein
MAKKIQNRFMGRLEKNPAKGGAWLVGYKIYYGDPNMKGSFISEKDSPWVAFTNASAGKRWLKEELFKVTGKKSMKFHEGNLVEGKPTYIQGDVLYFVIPE